MRVQGLISSLYQLFLNDIGGRPEQLPALQHVMQRTWAHWERMDEPGRPVSVADYESAGKLSSAMSDHANEVYEDSAPGERRSAR